MLAVLCGALSLAAGCHTSRKDTEAATTTGKHYLIKGIIVSGEPQTGEVTIDTEAIPGFMGAMTMPYKLKDPNVLQDLHTGDHMTGQLFLPDNGSPVLDGIVITSQARPDYKPSAQYHVPEPGDAVPDFRFTNQSGKQITMRQFQGKALLVTFIYTRCPLSDFCPKMSRNFAEIDKALAADTTLYDRTHLLSVSFDPAYDSPAVLRSYGGAYTGRYTQETFQHWDFAAPSPAELPKLLQFFDVGATPGGGKVITHSLSTALIGPDGKIAAWYPTNDWSPSRVVDAMKKAAAAAGAVS